MRIIDGRGELVELGDRDVPEMRAARVGLGMLGVVVAVQLQVEPRFHLRVEANFPAWDTVVPGLAASGSHDHLAVMWSPSRAAFERYGVSVPAGLDSRSRPLLTTYARAADGLPAHSVLPAPAVPEVPRFDELEHAVPVARTEEALQGVRRLVLDRHAHHAFPVYARFVAGDDAFLPPFADRDSVTVSVGTADARARDRYFAEVHRLLAALGGRPHWGKHALVDRDDVRAAYPDFSAFEAVRRQLDPDDVFLNDDLRRLFAT